MARLLCIVRAPLVALLTFALADELAQLALHAAIDGAPRPLAGWYRPWRRVTIWQVGTRPLADGAAVDWDRFEGTRAELERELAVGLTHAVG